MVWLVPSVFQSTLATRSALASTREPPWKVYCHNAQAFRPLLESRRTGRILPSRAISSCLEENPANSGEVPRDPAAPRSPAHRR